VRPRFSKLTCHLLARSSSMGKPPAILTHKDQISLLHYQSPHLGSIYVLLVLTSTRPIRCKSPVCPNQIRYVHLLRFHLGYHFPSLLCTSFVSPIRRSAAPEWLRAIDDALRRLKYTSSYLGLYCYRSPDVNPGLCLSLDGWDFHIFLHCLPSGCCI
jgi:hypothetical protein